MLKLYTTVSLSLLLVYSTAIRTFAQQLDRQNYDVAAVLKLYTTVSLSSVSL